MANYKITNIFRNSLDYERVNNNLTRLSRGKIESGSTNSIEFTFLISRVANRSVHFDMYAIKQQGDSDMFP